MDCVGWLTPPQSVPTTPDEHYNTIWREYQPGLLILPFTLANHKGSFITPQDSEDIMWQKMCYINSKSTIWTACFVFLRRYSIRVESQLQFSIYGRSGWLTVEDGAERVRYVEKTVWSEEKIKAALTKDRLWERKARVVFFSCPLKRICEISYPNWGENI